MEQEALIADIERRAQMAGVTIGALCRRAGVHPTTFSRWKRSPRNPNPIGANLTSISKLDAALRSIAEDRRRSKKAVNA